MFLLNSRIPLVRFSSESIVDCARGPRISDFTKLSPLCSKLCSVPSSILGSKHPILRANPFPEVTDLICRIPLSTLFYRPEAANLGDLMRLWVRPGVIRQSHSDFQGSL
jgi:hypothetical protein